MGPIATYAAAAAAMRDTTKWLVAVIPAAGSVLVIAEVVPAVVNGGQSGGAVVAVVAAGLAVALVIWKAVHVLQVDYLGWADLRSQLTSDIRADGETNPKSLLYAVQKSGLLPLYGFADVAALAKAVTADAAKQETRTAVETLVSFADSRSTEQAFRSFLWVVAFAVGLIAACVAWTVHATSGPSTIEVPVRVQILNIDTNHQRYAGCQDLRSGISLDGVAVSGTWSAPVVALTSSGCSSHAELIIQGSGVVVPAS